MFTVYTIMQSMCIYIYIYIYRRLKGVASPSGPFGGAREPLGRRRAPQNSATEPFLGTQHFIPTPDFRISPGGRKHGNKHWKTCHRVCERYETRVCLMHGFIHSEPGCLQPGPGTTCKSFMYTSPELTTCNIDIWDAEQQLLNNIIVVFKHSKQTTLIVSKPVKHTFETRDAECFCRLRRTLQVGDAATPWAGAIRRRGRCKICGCLGSRPRLSSFPSDIIINLVLLLMLCLIIIKY